MEDQVVKKAGAEVIADSGRELINIFGPCSAESREQLLQVSGEIALNFPGAYFRAGLWKPRTRPNNFEGIGSVGLAWLSEVREKTGLKIATEVANRSHVEECLKYELDALWIGARTTVNPFYVQEIADGLKDFKGSVFVKNPVVPDLSLWIGAVERIQQAGIENVYAIHRGFHHYDSKPFRNLPQWEIPIEFMSARPDIPMICDISHICGNPKLFQSVAQKAMDLNMAGLHIEVHPEPAKALSDAQQQITTKELIELLNQIELRKPEALSPDFQRALERLRNEIDEIDAKIIQGLTHRMSTVRKIGELKKENHVTILQLSRWQNIVNRYMSEGKELGLSESFLKEILTALHDEAMRNQNTIMND